MSVIKQIPSMCNSHSIQKEVHGKTLDKTDVDSYFYHNILTFPSLSIE